ncbi:bifunctional protein-serine/threonine kinase/phosphatase [Amphritea pacifica]|uniref:Bifunctional protein-serine/threonine kinase/phosphatase n=1 Tax=Amphritea pacifica TaxID=2811233 RepID=A0ABS2WDV1_9GAMM|nr:bifunctional protein-serine/threonine kinase/phosphatase [Amphritea pacifica]MBN0989801.1 bifunctional protein-serine/threonine kinase/phosphatase [Amphritea pacifica]MBN1008806.1 bifunctional protein-serine/threonine kinase/phosphatase [Amphritea pacifica]
MSSQLKLSLGQFSDKGVKEINQDFHGAVIPREPQLSLKGAALVLADGISTSSVSQVASEAAVKSFLNDYFCTSDTWTVYTSGLKVLEAVNGWLCSQTQRSEFRYNKDQGYVCTLSAAVFKAATVHLFHAGDSRVYRLRGQGLEQLTKDHRSWISKEKSYLSRAMGVALDVEFDYQAVALKQGDYFLLCTDGVYEFIDTEDVLEVLSEHADDLNLAAETLVQRALAQGSDDNLTLQIARVDQLPSMEASTLQQQVEELELPPVLHARQAFDGYLILREMHANSRSHVYLAEDLEDGARVVIKIPSVELRNNPAYLERFLMEEWVARRINSAHVMKAGLQNRQRHYLYSVTEYIEGITLKQWLIDNPNPDIETVRGIIEQVAKGLQAMHRMEILHQDLKPDNVMIDTSGTVKIIDFGGVRIAGIVEAENTLEQDEMQGTALYMAPEYFVGEIISRRSDQFSLAVLTYHMLSGRFPYDTQVAKSRTVSAQKRLRYHSVLDDEREIPGWIDYTLRKALNPNPYKRYEELSEFLYDLRYPNQTFLSETRPPLLDRNPLLFWKSISLMLAVTVAALLVQIHNLTQ